MPQSKRFKTWQTELLLLLSGALLFALSFPSFAYRWGFGILGYFCLIPTFLLIRRVGFVKSGIYGFLYGYIAYSLFNFWLFKFNPVSFVVVPMIYAVYFLFWFPIFKWADRTFPRYGYLVQLLFWLAYEIFRVQGFLGYSYGILGYSQYRFTGLIGIADLTGVLGVSLLVVFPSLWLARYLSLRAEEGSGWDLLKKSRFLTVPAALYILLFLGSLGYSAVSRVDYSESPVWKTSLIQHDINAWRSGIKVYKEALDKLMEISQRASAEDPDAVIWSETSFVPSIRWHDRRREERDKYELVQELKQFLARQDAPYIIGNNDIVEIAGERESYNAVLVFHKDEITDVYHKIHLVPFGEHFPYEKIFPRFYKYILKNGVTFYIHGDEYTVFDMGKAKASPLICFEDTFGYLSRNFVRKGAQVLVNVTNDSWSPAQACSIQHVGMAVFRTVENRRSMVRSTNGGFTCMIDPNGKITDWLEPFTADHLTVDVPVYDETDTFYTATDSVFDRLVMISSVLLGFLMLIITILRIRKERT